MSTNIVISVIIPAYNAAEWIRQTIQCAIDQTFAPVEVLVVDDGSTDATADIAFSFSSPVRLIRQPNAGPGSARNLGACQANGQWLAFLDADDLWLPTKLQKQVGLIEGEEIGIVHTYLKNGYRSPAPPIVTFERLWAGNCIGTSSVLIRKEAFVRAGGFAVDLPLAEDYDLWLRIAAAGWKIVTCPEQLTFYRQPPGCLTSDGERLTKSTLTCIKRIGRTLELPDAVVLARLLDVYECGGRTLLYQGSVGPARHWLGRALRLDPSIRRLLLWMKTYIPTPLLAWSRRLPWSYDREASSSTFTGEAS